METHSPFNLFLSTIPRQYLDIPPSSILCLRKISDSNADLKPDVTGYRWMLIVILRKGLKKICGIFLCIFADFKPDVMGYRWMLIVILRKGLKKTCGIFLCIFGLISPFYFSFSILTASLRMLRILQKLVNYNLELHDGSLRALTCVYFEIR